jgi:hypothetical protein
MNAPETLEQLDFGDMVQEPQQEAAEEKDDEEGVDKEGETKFHKKLDTLVHNTFGKRKDEEQDAEEGNKFSGAVAAAKEKGEDDFEVDGKKYELKELAEFIHSFYDKESGTFPKGPEGVCTMVGKKFGEQAESVARKFVERMAPQQTTEQNPELAELARVRELAGL